jgi:hypothetical protein
MGRLTICFFAYPHILLGHKTTDAEQKEYIWKAKYRCKVVILKWLLMYSVWGMECVGYVGRFLRTWK